MSKNIEYIITVNEKGAVQGLRAFEAQVKQAGTHGRSAIGGMNTELNNSAKSSSILGTSLGSIKSILGSIGITLGAVQIANVLKNSAGEAIHFQSVMANVESITRGSSISIDTLSDEVLRLGSNLGSSASLADALYEAIGAGVEPARAVEFVAEATKLAKAQLFEAGDATRLLATIMNAYGMEVGEVSHVSDVFSKTIAAGIVRGGELANSLGTVISTAALAKVPIEEVAAAVAIMTRAGISADEATTALNQALLSFISPSKGALEVAKQYGIELSASTLANLGFQGSMELVREKTGWQR